MHYFAHTWNNIQHNCIKFVNLIDLLAKLSELFASRHWNLTSNTENRFTKWNNLQTSSIKYWSRILKIHYCCIFAASFVCIFRTDIGVSQNHYFAHFSALPCLIISWNILIQAIIIKHKKGNSYFFSHFRESFD